MASYTVATDNFAPAPLGATVTDEELGGCNVEALLAGGTLVPADAPAAPPAPPVPPAAPAAPAAPVPDTAAPAATPEGA